ncbi:hydrogenase formation protein HupJ [Bradyrhizobium jicamae]|uniref:Hydrogenase formation protein HupJ n=1 Tax=Bradyrhizobium jicamae TaxID=280332 RepID=A0A0R3L9D5_9BRAD|nr:[NiFe]-hydrogenase assembly chaperone HybE [Bradyrhizobium jicamae]KRR02255.1 hydrogenase formation protein HupJ [Bradyrhizobium jicamae]
MTSDRDQHPRSSMHADPSAWGEMLAAVYRDIANRAVRDLSIFNEALSVEAIGFRVQGGRVVGIMVTPWFMNVVMPVPDGASQSSPARDPDLRVRFPGGDLEFTISELALVGPIASCSLFSPMFEFEDMATARATAETVFAALMSPADSAASHGLHAPHISLIDRRHFLRGLLTERAHEPLLP